MRNLSLLRLFVAAKRAAEAASESAEKENEAGGAGGIGEFSLSSTAAAVELLAPLKRRPSLAITLAEGAAATRDAAADAAAMALALSISA